MSDSNAESNSQNSEEQRNEPTQNQDGSRLQGMEAFKAYAMEHKIDIALWLTRAFTVLFCISYLLPIFSHPLSSYQKALMSSAATSALRLHQRIPNIQFTREFLAILIMEDSAHYLFYSIIFMYSSPITMVLVPIFLFALLHFASFSLGLIDIVGLQNTTFLGSRYLISLIEYQQRNMLRVAAFVEIFLMPLSAVSLFTGRVSLLTPVLYYRFLSLRYSSRRNAYTRTIFYELRVTAEYAVNRPSVPAFLQNFVRKTVAFISNLAPPVHVQ